MNNTMLPYEHNQLIAPGAWSVSYSVTGLDMSDVTDWFAILVNSVTDDQTVAGTDAAVAIPTVALSTVDGVDYVTFSLTEVAVLAFCSADEPAFLGYWSMRNLVIDQPIMAGTFEVSRTKTRKAVT